MGAFQETVRTVTLAAGAATRIWAAPLSEPFKDMTIWLLNGGVPTAAGNLDWEVFYGGGWTGEPFKSGSTHLKGKSQASGAIAGGTELCDMVWEDGTLLPPNQNIPAGRSVSDSALQGFPVVLYLKNNKAVPLTLNAVFVCRTVGDHV